MQTTITTTLKTQAEIIDADRILRSCVHCGFCTATCPTYQLLGDELDSPRGRIYLIKQLLEGQSVTHKTQLHLDRCLSCRACETICPSGVEYGHLLDIGRKHVARQVKRTLAERLVRYTLVFVLPRRKLFQAILSFAQFFRSVLPLKIKKQLPITRQLIHHTQNLSTTSFHRKMILLQGCVQPALAPNINKSSVLLLNKLGIEILVLQQSLCCGAITHHLNYEKQSLLTLKKNIDLWWPYIQNGVEAIVVNATGCTAMVKDYAHILRYDADYAEKAAKISSYCKDISEVLADVDLQQYADLTHNRIAFHPPCTLQHGLKLQGVVEKILSQAGFTLTDIKDKHNCCGSAGTYSILQATLSEKLAVNKINHILADHPDIIVTANIGCMQHLQAKTHIQVKHWIELFSR